MSLNFEDLSEWDIGLIKHQAIEALAFTTLNDRYVAITESVLSCIKSKGFNLINSSDKLTKEVSTYLQQFSKEDSLSLMFLIFEYLKSNNIVIIKDDSREPTWSKPEVPTKYESYLKPWMISWKN